MEGAEEGAGGGVKEIKNSGKTFERFPGGVPIIQRGCGTGEVVIRAAGIQMSLYPQESKRGAT